MSYFDYYPKITYNGKRATNLLLRSEIVREVFNKRAVYYTYVIKDGETAEGLANRFYRDPELSWVIYYSNDMLDPYYDWPLDYTQFNDFLRKKYNKSPQLLKADVKHYVYTGLSSDTEEEIKRITWLITPETWVFLTAQEKSGWSSVSIYDFENQKNEDKRQIQILDPNYISQIKQELGDSLNA